MSPTVFRARGFRFYFFSREESRMHVHVYGHSGEAKFWMDPQVEPAYIYGLSEADVKLIIRLVEEHEDDIRKAWKRHFNC